MDELKFPADIVFKAIIKNSDGSSDEAIKSILTAKGLTPFVTQKASKNGGFVAYTIAARFPSNETLQSVCREISSVEGFMSLF